MDIAGVNLQVSCGDVCGVCGRWGGCGGHLVKDNAYLYTKLCQIDVSILFCVTNLLQTLVSLWQ